MLVFRYFENNCSTCIEEELLNIKNHSSEIGNENIFILVTSNSPEDLTTTLKVRNMERIRIRNIPDTEVIFSKRLSGNKPFYFVLDSVSHANMIFEPDLRVPGLTEKYFEAITKRFFIYK
jgi:hypothetical protein